MARPVFTPLAAARKKSGLTLAQVSKAIGGYSRGGLSHIERGHGRPRPELAAKLVKLFNGEVTLEQILLAQKKPVSRALVGKKPSRSVRVQEAR